MKHLLGKSAQALFEFFQNSENFFYSLYRGTFVGFSVETGPGIPGKYEARKSKYETNPKPE
jgi:lipid-binding SYLF domain-containing protein